MQRVQSRVFHDFVIWLIHDDRSGGWRYNLAQRDRRGEAMEGPDVTQTFGPFLSLGVACQDATVRVRSLRVNR
jgi:hypothetical protein